MTPQQHMIWEKGAEVWSRLQNQKVFLTGGTGFFGRSLLELVAAYNSEKQLNLKVTVLTRNKESFLVKWPALANPKWVSFQEGDIVDFKFLDETFDHVLHFATPVHAAMDFENSLQLMNMVVTGTQRVMAFAVQAGAKHVLLASSGAVYGKQPGDIDHVPETYLGAPSTGQMASVYGEAKRVAELLGNLYSKKYGVGFKIARCFALAGPHLEMTGKFAFGNFIKDALSGDIIKIAGDGSARRSYLYSDDLILWLFKILLDGKSSEPYNVGSDQSISILELAKTIVKTVNPRAQVQVASATNTAAPIERYVPSIELAKTELGLEAWTALEQSVLETAKSYKQILAKQ